MQILIEIGHLLSALSTVAIAILTYHLWRENKALRKMSSEAEIVPHFETHPDGTGGLNLCLSNVGPGPAMDVTFSIISGEAEFHRYGVILDHSKRRSAITLVPSGGKFSFLFGIGYQLFNPKDGDAGEPLKPFQVEVAWRTSKDVNIVKKVHTLDVSQFRGLPGMMNMPYALQSALELKAMNQQLAALTKVLAPIVGFVDATKPENQSRQKAKGNPEPKEGGGGQ